jgi:uncharacterized protein (TIGR00297 family)
MPLALGAALIAILAAAAYALGIIALSGAVAGASVAFTILACAGLPGFIVLLAFFPILTYAEHATAALICATREGRWPLQALHPRSFEGIRRDGWQVLANGGVPALLAIAHSISIGALPLQANGWSLAVTPSPYLTAMTAALAFAASDTASHEIGEAISGRTFSPLTRKLVPPGTTGAVSLDGSFAALMDIVIIVGVAGVIGVLPPDLLHVAVAIIGAIAGNIADTLIGACVETRSHKWGNNGTNFAASIIAAATAVLLASLLS